MSFRIRLGRNVLGWLGYIHKELIFFHYKQILLQNMKYWEKIYINERKIYWYKKKLYVIEKEKIKHQNLIVHVSELKLNILLWVGNEFETREWKTRGLGDHPHVVVALKREGKARKRTNRCGNVLDISDAILDALPDKTGETKRNPRNAATISSLSLSLCNVFTFNCYILFNFRLYIYI